MRDVLLTIRCIRSAGTIELTGISKGNAITRAIGAGDSFAIIEIDKDGMRVIWERQTTSRADNFLQN